MHDTYFLLLFGIVAVGMWVLVAGAISHVGGWSSLADQYRCLGPFPGSSWNFQSGQFGGIASYYKCLTVGADPRGLFVRIHFPFRVAHPPLFIPWHEISVSRKKVLWVKQVRFRLGHELQIPLTIRASLAQKLQSAAGSAWPVESDH
jgi:hypothetical protein